MKTKKNKLIIFLAVLIIARVVIVFFENRNSPDHKILANASETKTVPLISDVTLSRTPPEAVTVHHSTAQDEQCQSLGAEYQNLRDVKKTEKVSIRFVNIHKKVDGIVYRTRFFYKDSSENEIPNYLLYREDQSDEDILIEKTPYKKGPQYTKIEKSPGTILYTEEGINIGGDQDMFLHYENNQLKDLQGSSLNPNDKDSGKRFIECRF